MKRYRKYFVTAIFLLLIGAVLIPGITSQICQKTEITPSSMGRWSDDFEGYTVGQFLDGDSSDGGWKGWDNDPQYGAFVVDDESHSPTKSVEIVDLSDLVHEYSGYTTGQWTYVAWQYVPEDFSGESAFILLNTYADGGTNSWSTQLRFNADNQYVLSDYDGNTLPLITGRWVEIRVEIDLDADIQDIFYDGDLLASKSWKDGVTGGGVANIGAVDLFANGASPIYYDDIELSGETPIEDLECSGSISLADVEPGAALTSEFDIRNNGDAGSLLDWEVTTWPIWGTGWTFTPASGVDLVPDAWVTVTVEFTAPDDPETEFTGVITVENSNNPADFCEIPVVVTTPVNNQQNQQNTIPLFFKILQQILNF